MGTIKYREGYKYQLHGNYVFYTDVLPGQLINTDYLILHKDGRLFIRDGYAWDGASGPAMDTKDFMRGSLVHDALYQLMSEGYLYTGFKKQCDLELIKLCKQDGMNWLRLKYVYAAVSIFGRGSDAKLILTAP